ncbi:MAG: hypothetical protein E6H71_01690 [Betaproteobacteria bacterium]|nr:MAG: hypothetical protein E6H71_01690 [Betaproteobacteria bacterium]
MRAGRDGPELCALAARIDPPTPVAPASGTTPRAKTPPATRGMLAVVALLLALASGLAWLDMRRDGQALRTDVAQRLANTDAALAQAKARESDLGNELRDTQAKVALLDARLAESQSQQAALETLYRELAPSRDELALTEVEQVLVLASQQLALAGNVQAALAALQLADGKLARMDRPQLARIGKDRASSCGKLLDAKQHEAVPAGDVEQSEHDYPRPPFAWNANAVARELRDGQ